DGRNYIYLKYRHDGEHRKGLAQVLVTARADIDQATAPLLGRSDFDAVLLVDRLGNVITQQSSSGLDLTSIDTVLDRQPDTTQQKKNGAAFDNFRGTTNLTRVTIGAAEYMLYAQPVQLSLMQDDASGSIAAEWTVCGLVRLDRFRAASSTIATTYWLWCGAVLALIVVAIPLLKPRVLSPREPLRRFDSASIALSLFAL